MPSQLDYDISLFHRKLDDGNVILVYRMFFNDRMTWGHQDDEGYERAFCFQQDGSAIIAALEWDGTGDPPGPWIKEVGTERYGPGLKEIK